jgi:four helix bundle protein
VRGEFVYFSHGYRIQRKEFKNSRSRGIRGREDAELFLLQSVDRQPAKTFRDLLVWQRAHELALAIYRMTADFPKHELFGLTSQLRRAAVSVPANFAEGFKRRGKADKARLYNIAQGSLEECRYYLILAQDLGYAETSETVIVLEEVSRFLESYLQRLLAPKPLKTPVVLLPEF